MDAAVLMHGFRDYNVPLPSALGSMEVMGNARATYSSPYTLPPTMISYAQHSSLCFIWY